MNFAPSGTMSDVDGGVRFTPRIPSQVPSFARSNNGRSRRGGADGARAGCALIGLLDVIGLRVDGGRLAAWQGDAPGGARCRVRRALAAEHALKERRGFGKLARMRQPRGFANCVLVQHRIYLVLSARAALTAGLACKAPSTETEAMVARARSAVTSWAMLARPRTLMCSISPARRAASRSARL